MSQQKNYRLRLKPAQGKGATLEIKISIAQRVSPSTGFKSTFKGRQIRMCKVLAKDDVKPSDPSDIEEIIPWNGTVPAYPYQDEDTGETKLLVMDDKTKCKLFQKSESMNGLGLIPREDIKPYMYDGSHYFLTVQKKSKTEPEKSDVQGYNILHYVLSEHNKMLLVKFVSSDREKFAVIYPDSEILSMSILIHNNYHRTAPTVSRIPLPKAKEHAEKMVKVFSLRRFEPSSTNDLYEDNILKYIEDLKQIAKGVKPAKLKATLRSEPAPADEDDFFSQLDSM